MDDDEMIGLVSRALLDPAAKRPSIETLLHAFLPFRHIDHVHADAVCALTNHPHGREAVAEALGEGFAYVEWKRSGFELSKMVGELADSDGVVLAQHGLITWGDTSDESLARTLEVVGKCEDYVAAKRLERAVAPTTCPDVAPADLERMLLNLRGAIGATGRRSILFVDERLRAVADRSDLDQVVAASVSTADHMLRIKPWSVVLDKPGDGAAIRAAVADYVADYEAFVERNADRMPAGYGAHASEPTVALVPGLGSVTAAANRRDATALSEVAFHTHSVAAASLDAFGAASAMSDVDTFDVDYWPMELYKLSLKPPPAALAGRVFVVTGAGSGIGRGVALHLAGLGANLVIADLDGDSAEHVADEAAAIGADRPLTAVGDQSDSDVVESTIATTIRHYGGLDGIVANAGIAKAGELHELSVDDWQRVLDVNLTSAFLLTRGAVRALREQGIGGSLVYIASKNAFGPGAGFGAYSASKAAMLQLMRIAALEGGPHGIRANAINPDAVFDNSALWDGGIREERAAAHGIAPDELEQFYAQRNLLHRRVRTTDVAAAAAFLLGDDSSRTTGAVVPVDGGVAAAFPR